MHLDAVQWALAIAGALFVGVSKTGIAGLGMLFVVLFAQILPAKQATGIVLPLLIFGDVIAVGSYRRHTQWRFLWRLFPWTAAGVLLGFFALGRIDDRQARILIGGIVLGLLALHLLRRVREGGRRRGPDTAATASAAGECSAGGAGGDDRRGRPVELAQAGGRVAAVATFAAVLRPETAEPGEHGWWFAPMIGVLAGFTTLVANAAGPLMVIYLLAMRLPKMEFVGTGAVFFLLLNCFKVPFMVDLGLINRDSFAINLWLAPAVLGGAFLGRLILRRLDQRLFENLALVLSAVAGAKLLW